MYLKTWERGASIYASIYRSDRVEGKVKTREVAYLGKIDASQIPYLKAAFSKKKPIMQMSSRAYPV